MLVVNLVPSLCWVFWAESVSSNGTYEQSCNFKHLMETTTVILQKTVWIFGDSDSVKCHLSRRRFSVFYVDPLTRLRDSSVRPKLSVVCPTFRAKSRRLGFGNLNGFSTVLSWTFVLFLSSSINSGVFNNFQSLSVTFNCFQTFSITLTPSKTQEFIGNKEVGETTLNQMVPLTWKHPRQKDLRSIKRCF